MIDDKVTKIINKMDESKEIKRLRELEKIILNNDKYINLIDNFNKNRNEYEKNNILNEEIIKLRKSLFEIEEVKEYSKLESEIRLYSKKISNEISSIVEDNNKKC